MTTLPPIPEAAQDAADAAADALHGTRECYGCCFRGGYSTLDAAYPHIVIATLRWAAEQLPKPGDNRDEPNPVGVYRSNLRRIADEIEAGLPPT